MDSTPTLISSPRSRRRDSCLIPYCHCSHKYQPQRECPEKIRLVYRVRITWGWGKVLDNIPMLTDPGEKAHLTIFFFHYNYKGQTTQTKNLLQLRAFSDYFMVKVNSDQEMAQSELKSH